ncbi:cytochrome b5-like heme/steroid binding domain-containing protein [Aspergillus egyptiacus]|nr:cytochrome b5-like heme/steroid binding domain-containing protein [Aspergillus egyptiacus]
MSSSLRQRAAAQKDGIDTPKADTESKRRQSRTTDDSGKGISTLDILRLLVTFVALSCGLSYYITSSESLTWGYNPWWTKWPQLVRYIKGPLSLTPAELSLYDGTDPSLPIYVAVNGTVFDVSANPGMYGPGGSYHFFAGRDATRAFVTGCFQEDLTDDLAGVEEMFVPVDEPGEEERLSGAERKIRREKEVRMARKRVEKQVAHWVGFFGGHEKYFEVGRVVKPDGVEDPKRGKRELCEAARKRRPKRKSAGGESSK